MAENIQSNTSGVVDDENCKVWGTDQPRKQKKKIYSWEIIKKAQVSGLEHKTHKRDKVVTARAIETDCRCKRYRCFQITTQERRSELLNMFDGIKSKVEQVSYLSGLVSVIPVQRRRSRIDPNINRTGPPHIASRRMERPYTTDKM
ncbi:unnamed protein product [Psylliodes chrysocephalus]|uniref:Uncharacterized protein n=1 Tax=Psylliodes chrysocephalus TaxID=3402493 RepID=A0A9P0G3J4_9CUCU|nr:unnamed protein product [Psylliodes chrysocephala]